MAQNQSLIIKYLEFSASSLDDLRAFPDEARREAGSQLDRVQRGLEPLDWKPMPNIGSGVKEIRIRDSTGAYRLIYIEKFSDTIYVLHCFKKTTQRTRQSDIRLAQQRYRELMQKHP